MVDPRAGASAGDSGDEITDDSDPNGVGLNGVVTEVPLVLHNARTRRYIAFGLLGVVAFIYIGLAACWVVGIVTIDDAIKFIVAIGGIQSLAAAVVGYYFGKDS